MSGDAGGSGTTPLKSVFPLSSPCSRLSFSLVLPFFLSPSLSLSLSLSPLLPLTPNRERSRALTVARLDLSQSVARAKGRGRRCRKGFHP
jgi:hypothetical protein